jgi:hypothetical protein
MFICLPLLPSAGCLLVMLDCAHALLQNDLEFLRVRSAKHEVMVAPSKQPHARFELSRTAAASASWRLQQLCLAPNVFSRHNEALQQRHPCDQSTAGA